MSHWGGSPACSKHRLSPRSSCSSGRFNNHSSKSSRSGAARISVKRVVVAQPRAAVRNGQQVQIVIAQGNRCGIAQRAHPPQYLQRGGAAIDQIPDEPEPVAVRREAHRLKQRIELRVAALHVADSVERH